MPEGQPQHSSPRPYGFAGTSWDDAQARAHLAAIVDSSEDAILSKALDGTILSWNRAAERLYGYSAEEIVGSSISRLLPPDREEELASILARLRQGEAVERLETVRVSKDGARIPVSLTISPVRDARGVVVGASSIAHDISERKRLEAELQAARDHALDASRLKSEFLATMSHEIRTPLNGVVGMLGLLLDTELDPQQRQYAETAGRSAESLLSVINDVLDFSKIEAGKIDVEIMSFDLRTVVGEVAELLAQRAHAKGLELATLTAPDVPSTVRGDPGRIRQVLVNLIGNAIKFTDAGEVVTRCGVVEDSAEHVVVRVDVTDTGVGINPTALETLFEPFTQADASTTRTHGGTGLGLAISARLAELMGGSLSAVSEPGHGSTFSFVVPLGKDPSVERAPVPVRPSLRGLRVLIVDDNATNCTILESQTASWGMTCVTASDGFAALQALELAAERAEPFDVALVDMDMPGMDGLELTSRLRSARLSSALPVVLLTSSGVRGSAERARGAGVSAYLPKPVRQSQLYDALAIVLAGGGGESMVTRHTVAEARARRHPRLLVAEDNSVNQQVAAAMLAQLGFRADVVGDGAEAVEAVERGRYGAVLMDCQMPEMDGYEATAEIRRREGDGPHIPVIALTAGAMQGERERCLAAGMDDYLAKPVRLEELDQMLRRWVASDDEGSPGGAGDEEPAHGHDPLLDEGQVAELRQVMTGPEGAAALQPLVEAFSTSGTARAAEMRVALTAHDLGRVASLAHSLAGSSASLGARVVADLARRLEAAAADGSFERASALVDDLAAALPPAAAALRRAFAAEAAD